MRIRMAAWGMLGLASLAIGGPPNRTEAQIIAGTNPVGGGGAYAPGNFGYTGLGNTPIPETRQGTWGEILTVSPRGWLVLQDGEGRQYPVSTDAIHLFLIRWPTSADHLGADALVEVTGVNLESNTIRADHADVYEGGARSLVSPTMQNLVGYNRTITPYDVDQMNTYGARYFLLPGEEQIPNRTHVVGPVVGLNPMQVAIGGNNALTVLPPLGGMTMSRVTMGSLDLVRRGDLAYFVADEALPKTLVLSQLVIYKKQPAPQ